jgi:hypothetical protein
MQKKNLIGYRFSYYLWSKIDSAALRGSSRKLKNRRQSNMSVIRLMAEIVLFFTSEQSR